MDEDSFVVFVDGVEGGEVGLVIEHWFELGWLGIGWRIVGLNI